MANSLPCPKFDWKSQDQLRAFDQFQAKAELWLAGEKTEKELQYTKIVLMLGDEGLSRWTKFKLSEDDRQDPGKVFKAFRDSLGSDESFRTARAKLYLFRQQKGETVNEMDIRLSRLTDECRFPTPEIAAFLKRDILINAISYYEVKKWVNQQKEDDAFTYLKVVDECRKYEAAVRDYISMKHDNPDLKTAYQEGIQKCDSNPFSRRRKKHRGRSRSRSHSRSESRDRKKPQPKSKKPTSKCKRCGFENHTTKDGQCPAINSTCGYCTRIGHLCFIPNLSTTWKVLCGAVGLGGRQETDRLFLYLPPPIFFI